MTDPNRKKRRAAELAKRAEEERADYRANFVPHAIIETEASRPSQITIYGIIGGHQRFRYVFFDASTPEAEWPRVALGEMWEMIRSFYPDRPEVTAVPFFGEPTGVTVNYTPDLAITYDLELNETAWYDAARRLGPIRFRPKGLDTLVRGLQGTS